MNFKEELAKRVEEIEEIIKAYLPKEEGNQKVVLQAMNYSILAGGKRLRPMLMQEAYRLFGEYVMRAITGSSDIDSTWDDYVDTIWGMKLQECIDVKQTAYDRYCAREIA